nr:hypothetical protein [uncultured Ottowia sp.]
MCGLLAKKQARRTAWPNWLNQPDSRRHRDSPPQTSALKRGADSRRIETALAHIPPRHHAIDKEAEKAFFCFPDA